MSFRLLSVFFLTCGFNTWAEDIELYVKHNISNQERPRVIMLFDTSGSMAWDVRDGQQCYVKNWYYLQRSECFKSSGSGKACYRWWNGAYRKHKCDDSRLTVAKDAMKTLVTKNPDIDFGLMRLYSGSGGYVMSGLGSSQSDMLSKIDKLPASGSTPLSETLWEAYLYLSGQAVDYAKNRNDRDKSIESGGSYLSAFKRAASDKARCDNSINMILMTDGDPTSDSGKNTEIKNRYYGLFGHTPSAVSGNYLNSLAKTLRGTNQNKVDLYTGTSDEQDFARVFTIGFGTGMSSSGKKLLAQTATDGGGQYLHANTANQLVEALNTTIINIRNISSSFTSPTVSANANDQTQSGDYLYYTMFKPETHTRWRGNLKKLKVAGHEVQDQQGASAISSEGVIAQNATTFWSEPGSQDGNNIEFGGINYALEKASSRTLYSDYGKGKLYTFNYDVATQLYGGLEGLSKKLGYDSSNAQAQNVINWARGIDVDDEDRDYLYSDNRQDIFGDPLHSRVVTMNYGSSGGLRVIVGTNAGFLHMFKDKGNTVEESWAFIPDTLLDIIKPLRERKEDDKLYGMDGPITVYFYDKNENGVVESADGDKVWLIVGMRRGGSEYYGFNITNPDSPELLWGGPIKGGQGDFKELGQTWSKPVITFIEKSKDKPVMIFGAGYSTNKDTTRDGDEVGRGIYIVDIETGKPIWSLVNGEGSDAIFNGKHGVVGDVSLTDSDYDGFTDRLYFADTGGSIWRVDMPGPDPDDSEEPWSVFELARLGGTGSDDRRFFYQPIMARTFFSKVTIKQSGLTERKVRKDTPFEAIIIGSGNRAKPTGTSVKDYLFMIRDMNTKTQSFKSDAPEVITIDDLMDVSNDPFGNNLSNLDKFTDKEAELGAYDGWKYGLAGGEKSLSTAGILGGVVYFTTFTPADLTQQQACTITGGKGQLYAFHLHYGTGKIYETAQDLPDTPTFVVKREVDDSSNGLDKVFKSKFWLPAPGLKSSSNEPLTPFSPTSITTPEPIMKNGKIVLFSDIGFSIRTKQLYIYKREENDEK